MAVAASGSRTWTYFEDRGHEGNVPLMGPRTHATWLCSMVFDGGQFLHLTPIDMKVRELYWEFAHSKSAT